MITETKNVKMNPARRSPGSVADWWLSSISPSEAESGAYVLAGSYARRGLRFRVYVRSECKERLKPEHIKAHLMWHLEGGAQS